MVVLEGAPRVVRHGNGRIEIVEAPPVVRISLEFLANADPVVVKTVGRRIVLADQVVYEVTGWDGAASALLADLVEDRRSGR